MNNKKNYVQFLQPVSPTEMENAVVAGNLFSTKDHVVVKRAIQFALSDEESEVVLLRFWDNQLPHEIAFLLDQTTPMILKTLREALEKIKAYCIRQPEFSRMIPVPVPNAA